MRRRGLVLVALALAAAAPASAGTPGTWTRVTSPQGRNIDQVGLGFDRQHVLHVLWTTGSFAPVGQAALFDTAIAADGKLGAPVVVASSWSSMSQPAAATGGVTGTLLALYGGIRTTDAGETNTNLNAASSPTGAGDWTLQPGNVAALGGAYASPMSATAVGDELWEGWGGTGAGAFVHPGLNPSTPNVDLQALIGGGCCGYDVDVAGDPATARVVAAWYSNATGHEGVWAQAFHAPGAVDPAGTGGTTDGAPMRMPGSVTTFHGQPSSSDMGARVPIVGGSAGFTIAYPGGYPSQDRVLVWRVGAPSATTVAKQLDSVGRVTLAQAADGRLWVAWAERLGGRPAIVARRSNAAATVWGAPVTVRPVAGTTSIWSLSSAATAGAPLDLVANLEQAKSLAGWHTRVLPGLTLTGPAKLARKKATKATFVVLDAGDPVKGATVAIGAISAKTSAAGKAKFTLGPFGKHARSLKVVATLAGYADRKLTVKVG